MGMSGHRRTVPVSRQPPPASSLSTSVSNEARTEGDVSLGDRPLICTEMFWAHGDLTLEWGLDTVNKTSCRAGASEHVRQSGFFFNSTSISTHCSCPSDQSDGPRSSSVLVPLHTSVGQIGPGGRNPGRGRVDRPVKVSISLRAPHHAGLE